MDKGLHDKHRERVRDRFVKDGLDSFEEHQVLEFLLFYCYRRIDTNEIAHKMLNEFGSLYKLFEASPQEIVQKCKVTMNVAVLISLIPSLSKRYFLSRWDKKELLDTSKKAGQYATVLFIGQKIECFYLICLNKGRELIYAPKVFEGTISETPVYPREVVLCALKHSASSVILAHNHPGGILSPSRSDIEATKKIIAALETVEIDVLDHIIVAGDKYYSFSEKKTLPLWY